MDFCRTFTETIQQVSPNQVYVEGQSASAIKNHSELNAGVTCDASSPGASAIAMDWHSSSKTPFASKKRAVGPCSETGGFSNGAPQANRVGYARVSTQGQSLEQQLAVLTEAGCTKTYGEKVSSTVPSHKRQALQDALGSLGAGDTLVVAKLDRLGRTQSEVVARLAELSDRGIYVETLDGLLNTAALGRMAPLVIGLLTGLAEVERSLIQERTRESVEHRRRTGGNIGGRPALAEGRKELIKRLREEGMSYREVAEACGLSLATAHRYGKGC